MANARNHDMGAKKSLFNFIRQGEAHRNDFNCLKVICSILMNRKDEEAVCGLPQEVTSQFSSDCFKFTSKPLICNVYIFAPAEEIDIFAPSLYLYD